MKKLYIIGFAFLGLASCKPKIEPEKPGSGNVDVSRYLAVGNSLTAGYMDNSLYKEGQENSYPQMLWNQFVNVLTDFDVFKQPLLPGQHGYPTPKYVLKMKLNCEGKYTLTPVLFEGALDSSGASASVAYYGPYNNTGIPGIRCIDYVVPGYGAANPYSARFFHDPVNNRPIDDVLRINHTFFTAWVGNNDVMGYVTGGGEGSPTGISDIVAFSNAFDTIITKLTGKGQKGVVINIPDILATPFVNTIPIKGLALTRNGADTLNDDYNGTGMRFNQGANYFVIEDTSEPIKMRQIREGEYVLLSVPMDSLTCGGWGSKKPIPSQFVLTSDEVAKIKNAISLFNSVMQQKAAFHNLPVVDMYSYMSTLESGIKFGGVDYSTKYVSGGAFSLDGVHLTPRGYALVANKIIMTINQFYGSSFSQVDVNKYRGNLIP